MTFRLHSRLVVGNLFIIGFLSFLLALVLSPSQLVLIIFIAICIMMASVYLVHILISRPLHEISAASRKLAAGDLEQRLPITGEEEIAAIGTSLNAMARNLSTQFGELSAGKQRLEKILEAMGEGVMVLDRSGRISLTNGCILNLLGTDRDLAGKTPLEVFRRPELENAVRAVLGGESAQVLDITVGNGRILQANVAPVAGASTAVDSVVIVFHDLTDIRRTERMRRDFVANVSHEFKTPLTSIRGYAETLLSGAKDDPKIALDFLKTIERNAEHLEALVSDLLTLARLEAEVPARKEQINVKSLIDDQIASRKKAVRERDIKITVDCADITVQADRSRLSAALSNLIDNAIHYNKPGGEIGISAQTQNGTLDLAISDTGLGIPSEELPRIFERFYRVDKARARDSGRTGLGLAIVKHAIESQGGAIRVTSRLGSGSTFTIRLPI
jgi:two-component system phosphate regulon sensor histidine kinase PhoR